MRNLHRAAVVALLSFVFLGTAGAQVPLTETQQKICDEIKAGLDSVETALADTQAKLAASDTAGAIKAYSATVNNYNNHIRRLNQVPANHPTSVALREQAAKLGGTLKEVAASLRAAQAAKPGDKQPGGAAPAAGAQRLDYRQDEQLKNARFYLNEIDTRSKRLDELLAGKLDTEAIAESRELMGFIQQRLGYANKALTALPAEFPAVATELKRAAAAEAQVATATASLDKAAPAAQQQTAALGQQMTDDLAMVDSWSKGLGNPQELFQARPDDAIATVNQMPQMREALNAMLQRWNARVAEKPGDATAAAMVNKLNYVDEKLTDVEKAAGELTKSLPADVAAQIAEIETMIATAVSDRKPLYFGPQGGIEQKLGQVDQSLKLLTTLDPAAGETASDALLRARDKSKVAQEALSQDIINNNKKPAEQYNGPDKEDLRQRIIENWKQAHPDNEIVLVVFNTAGWSRTTRWDWNEARKGFEKVDYDRLQPKLFYKLDDMRAVEVPIELRKDYMKDGRLSINPWDIEAEPSVQSIYLLENLK